ncbi:disease resistance protein PIK6-NP-like isoform X1 [Carex rostrata]
MEAAAIGVANTALNSVVQTAVTTITNEIGLLLGVQEELFFIKEELEMMQGFLQVAKTDNLKDVLVSIWVKQVQELAFDVEDCLQEASFHLVKKSCLPVMCSVKKRDDIAKKIRMLKTRIEDVSKRNLRYELIKKGNSGHKYNESASTRSIANIEALLVGLDVPKRKLVDLIRMEHIEYVDKPWNGKVISVVGMGGLGKTTLVREVYGCQELRNVFNNHFAWVTVQHPFHKDEFIESLAKQVLSNFQAVDDEGETMEGKKKKSEENSKKTTKESLAKKVKEYLKDKKYLIVLDDLSSVPEWDMIKDVLSSNNGSRIIVTTQSRSPLAEHISHPSENIYEIKELSKNDALDLFFKAVYKTANYPRSTETTEGDSKAQKQCITNNITDEKDREIIEEPPHENKCNMKNGSNSPETTEENSEVREQSMTKEMKTQAGLIVESCGRLPLAIVTIGSYMATKPKTSAEWKDMHDHLSSELANNGDLGKVNTVLTSSYDGMPYHLKPSLLYLSVFHNHKEIRRSRIIRRWMADGYVIEGRINKEYEIKNGYFYELMGRSLILPSQMSTIVNGDVKRCNIHDIMYELILRKAIDESMVSVIQDGELNSMTDKVRHLVITGEPCTRGKVLERVDLSHMRSLSIFGEVGDYLKYSRMKLVRVLDLEGTINLNDGDLRSIGKLRHLKYLGLRGTKIRKLPNSLGKLSELETLDIRNTGVVRLPIALTKLHKLSYLRAGSVHYIDGTTPIGDFFGHINSLTENWHKKFIEKCFPTVNETARSISDFVRILCIFCCLFPIIPCAFLEEIVKNKTESRFSGGVRVPQGIGKLRSLNIFGVIDIGGSESCESLAKEMQNLTNLRKLAVTGFTKKNRKTLAKVIDGLKHLRSLFLSAADESGLRCCLDYVSSPPKYLQSLKLYSSLGDLPNWISSLENLEKIHLRGTYLTRGIKVIEKLPNLKILYLLWCSFEEDLKELCFGEDTFPMLQVMILESLRGLESVVIEKTALKRLEQLKIRRCWEMREDGVSGLNFLEQLKEMEVVQVLSFYNSEVLQKITFGRLADYFAKTQQRNNLFVSNLQEKLSMHPTKPVLRVIKEEDVRRNSRCIPLAGETLVAHEVSQI